MANAGIFTATLHVGAGLTPGTVDTSLTAPTNVTTLFTAGANGSKVEQIRINQVVTTAAAGIVNIFLYDGSAYRLFDQYTFGALTVSATIEAVPVDLFYNTLILPSGWSVRCTQTAAAVSAFCVTCIGGDY